VSKIEYNPIGIIHSPFKECKGTPIQAAASGNAEGIIEVYPEYAEGLKDLKGFSHIILIYHFHLAGKLSLKVKPYLDNRLRGLFATRAPSRPNSIGLSMVQLIKVAGAKLYIRNLDIVDGTPLLDIKPYVPEFDKNEVFKTGWLEKNIYKLPKTKDDNRFGKHSIQTADE
jgi:tRNA-Thr(GGU) m(6)t(6)A37 methyltransferase TsaA